MLSNTLFEVNEILQMTLLHYAAESPTQAYNDSIVDEMITIIEKIDHLRNSLGTSPQPPLPPPPDTPSPPFDWSISQN